MTWNHKKLVILPIRAQNTKSSHSHTIKGLVIITYGIQFHKTIKPIHPTIGLILKDVEDLHQVVLNEVEQLLHDYRDMSPQKLPNELPRMRDIQHNIDLMPRASM